MSAKHGPTKDDLYLENQNLVEGWTATTAASKVHLVPGESSDSLEQERSVQRNLQLKNNALNETMNNILQELHQRLGENTHDMSLKAILDSMSVLVETFTHSSRFGPEPLDPTASTLGQATLMRMVYPAVTSITLTEAMNNDLHQLQNNFAQHSQDAQTHLDNMRSDLIQAQEDKAQNAKEEVQKAKEEAQKAKEEARKAQADAGSAPPSSGANQQTPEQNSAPLPSGANQQTAPAPSGIDQQTPP
ncbi:hypothetical protein F5050DRAFT_1713062 [Lentinula boryana]|uniref:Uncharacterized protein n=1 Tax=Lentinula boryana TaxID=40481 RepID=A0ABQ8Q9M6_9AGAR|nr:hypothetical protein F5050DRAFT_1713062 [Lentinula boryana]